MVYALPAKMLRQVLEPITAILQTLGIIVRHNHPFALQGPAFIYMYNPGPKGLV